MKIKQLLFFATVIVCGENYAVQLSPGDIMQIKNCMRQLKLKEARAQRRANAQRKKEAAQRFYEKRTKQLIDKMFSKES